MPSWHPPDSDSGMVQEGESTIKLHNDANACFFRIPLYFKMLRRRLGSCSQFSLKEVKDSYDIFDGGEQHSSLFDNHLGSDKRANGTRQQLDHDN